MRMLLAMMLLAGAVATAQPGDTLEALHQSFEQQRQAALAAYGRGLDELVTALKRRGDFDNLLIVHAEKKRFTSENSVPAPLDTKDPFRVLAHKYQQTVVGLMERQQTKLEELMKQEVLAERLDSAQAVKREKDRVAQQLSEAKAKLPTGTPPAGTAGLQPLPAHPLSRTKVLVNETRGWAGAEPKHNVYRFNVERPVRRATFRFWGSGDIGTDTAGQVLIAGPGLQEQVIRKWQPKDFGRAANSVDSYHKLRAISCDVSAQVKQPGEYQFTFRWGGSPVGLSILRVELELD